MNIRITQEDADVLHALAFLQGEAVAEVLRPAIARFLANKRNQDDVVKALQLLERRRPATRKKTG